MGSRQNQIKELRAKLVKVRAQNGWAWEMYGSELCGPAMLREEQMLEDQIKKLEGKK